MIDSLESRSKTFAEEIEMALNTQNFLWWEPVRINVIDKKKPEWAQRKETRWEGIDREDLELHKAREMASVLSRIDCDSRDINNVRTGEMLTALTSANLVSRLNVKTSLLQYTIRVYYKV